jgi:hypothetical protein
MKRRTRPYFHKRRGVKARRDIVQASKILKAAGRALADALMKTEDADALLGRSSIHPKQEIMLEEIIAHLKEAGKTLRKLMEIL